MSKWKCDICNKEFDNFHAQGFDNKIYCPLCFFKEENRRLKDRINKAVEHISNEFLCYDNESDEYIQGLKTIDLLKGDKE